MGDTSIQWTDKTWNPIRGCSMAKGSELGGCLNCYAAAQAVRFAGGGGPFHLFARRTENGARWTGKVELIEKHLRDPLHWRKPQRVFVNSMSDLFHEALSDSDILSVFQMMGKCPAHTFQILTKRPGRMLAFLRERSWRNLGHSPHMGGDHHVSLLPGDHRNSADAGFLPNVWLGVSVEDLPTWDARVHLLKQTPAAVRFVSYEPALADLGAVDLDGIDWLIVGGESGSGARPFKWEWAEAISLQCGESGTAFFMKQGGANCFDGDDPWVMSDRKGGDMNEFPEELRVRQFPGEIR